MWVRRRCLKHWEDRVCIQPVRTLTLVYYERLKKPSLHQSRSAVLQLSAVPNESLFTFFSQTAWLKLLCQLMCSSHFLPNVDSCSTKAAAGRRNVKSMACELFLYCPVQSVVINMCALWDFCTLLGFLVEHDEKGVPARQELNHRPPGKGLNVI